jgi:Na+-transporting NADH:ubiquinone oxidoreductase subunit C
MFAVTAAFSSVVLGFSRLTLDRVKANRRLAFEKAVLEALPIDLPPDASNQNLHALFVKNVEPSDDYDADVYRLVRDGRTAAYALPFAGRGFWDEIRGVVGVGSDRHTITGVAFHKQNETPGLGAEITEPRFRGQFETGKKRIAASGPPLVFVSEETEAAGASEINALTGATQTTTRLERILNERLRAWREREEAK